MVGTGRVMVVDDNPMFTESMAAVLEAHGFEVARCHSGRECLDTVAEFGPDVIVSDYDMSGLDGLALLSELQGTPETAHIPFVAVTGFATPALRDRFSSAGACACHSKMEASDVLLDTLDKLLGGKGGRSQQEEIRA